MSEFFLDLAELSYLNLQNTVVTGDVGGLAGLAHLSRCWALRQPPAVAR
jgi:hypothetical protein